MPGVPVYSLLLVCVLPIQSAHETAGAAGTRHSPRPPGGERFYANLGCIAPRDREAASDRYKCATLNRHTTCVHPRGIQCSEASVMKPKSCGVLDTPLSRSMTIFARERCDAQFRLRHSGARASANPESRDSGFDASHRPGMTASDISSPYNASSTALAISAVPLLPPNSIGLMPSA
jgi:hypothetical protein